MLWKKDQVEIPQADKYVPFDVGGAALTKGRANDVYLSFYSAHNRIINETRVQYYLLTGGNLRDVKDMIHSAWMFSCERASEKQISRPKDVLIKDIIYEMQELLGLETTVAKD